jgi:polyhydroxyalkanoate synthesis regulator phasin
MAKKEMDIFLSEFIDKTKSDGKLTTDEENKLKSKILTSDEKNKLLQDNKLKTIIEEIIND